MTLKDKMYDHIIAAIEDSNDGLDWNEANKASDACAKIAEEEAVGFLEFVRKYEHESGNAICYDERTSQELFTLYQQEKEKK